MPVTRDRQSLANHRRTAADHRQCGDIWLEGSSDDRFA